MHLRRQIIQNTHMVPAEQQPICHMGPNKTRAASDQYLLAHETLLAHSLRSYW
jgi:hypothetical protein